MRAHAASSRTAVRDTPAESRYVLPEEGRHALDPNVGAEAASAIVAFLLAAGSRDWAQVPEHREAFINELLSARGDDGEALPQLASALDAVLVAKPLRLSAKASAPQLSLAPVDPVEKSNHDSCALRVICKLAKD